MKVGIVHGAKERFHFFRGGSSITCSEKSTNIAIAGSEQRRRIKLKFGGQDYLLLHP